MSVQLEELSFKLNSHTTDTGISFDALLNEDGDMLTVYCSDAPETPIFTTVPDGQILTVTGLFHESDVKEGLADEMHVAMLSLGPVMPLSSIGKQGGNYILYGSMSNNTVFENIVHELRIQVDNTLEAIDALNDYLK